MRECGKGAGRSDLDRRRMLAQVLGLGALPFVAAVASAQTEPSAPQRFGAIRVDVAPLAAIGGGASAGLIARVLPDKLRAEFAARLGPADPRAPVLVARIDRLFLSSYADAPSPGFDSMGSTDSMEGAGLVLAGHQLVSTTPLRVSLPAGYSGAYYLPDIDQRRITSLCESFASWLHREMAS